MNRVVVSAIAVIGLLLTTALIGYLIGGWYVGPGEYTVAAAEPEYRASKYDDRIFQLDREAADNAYRNQIEKLFEVWMRDTTGQPARAVQGARTARSAYIDVMNAIEKREADTNKLRELNR